MERNEIRFEPRRAAGLAAHLLLMTLLGAASVLLFDLATRAALGPGFLAALLGSLGLALPLPLLAVRMSALLRSSYRVSRDGIRLRWGNRGEDIPITEVLWVEPARDLVRPLTLPRPRWPGAVVGTQIHPDAGVVEFMAAESEGLLLVGTAARTYAISPGDPAGFIRAYQAAIEQGSLGPLRPWSARPRFLLAELWQQPAARLLLTTLALLNLTLFVWVGLAVPALETVSLGYLPTGNLQDPVPAVQLFLLPMVSVGLGLAGLGVAAGLHRRQPGTPLAYVVWGGSVVSSALFFVTVYVILQNA